MVLTLPTAHLTLSDEADFLRALQTAYRNFGNDLVVTLPDGTSLTDAELRERYPPR
jgi:hypothetical protein